MKSRRAVAADSFSPWRPQDIRWVAVRGPSGHHFGQRGRQIDLPKWFKKNGLHPLEEFAANWPHRLGSLAIWTLSWQLSQLATAVRVNLGKLGKLSPQDISIVGAWSVGWHLSVPAGNLRQSDRQLAAFAPHAD